MPSALVYYEGQSRIKELFHSLLNLEGWNICFNEVENSLVQNIERDLKNIDLHFIVYSKKLEPESFTELHFLRLRYPFTFIIYYYRYLINQQFLKLSELGINSCVIGEQHPDCPSELLLKLWQKHWKRIPESIYPKPKSSLPPRAKRILGFIENKTLNQCQIKNVAEFLKISQSHFRAEFKYYFGINFREFKQKLFSHYESMLLLNHNKYKPTEIYRLLNYSTLANLSRSFKHRHGEAGAICVINSVVNNLV